VSRAVGIGRARTCWWRVDISLAAGRACSLPFQAARAADDVDFPVDRLGFRRARFTGIGATARYESATGSNSHTLVVPGFHPVIALRQPPKMYSFPLKAACAW